MIIDKSTDVSVNKQLGLVIKYFSPSKGLIVGTFLKLEHIESGDAETIVQGVKSVINEFDLDLQKCVGIGTDNASVMVGTHNGVYARMKREMKHFILVPYFQILIWVTCSKNTCEMEY